ncbi:hypothetical protein NPIL_508311 [Nephila pilipes]|uniref:Transmembrane protein n=1 Tax=Nephila pilipes TaxID=299642 RepID=A0A8X6QJB5_NEPPI|nr:hypothetical protein NPIL_508311 [Nephila pilipes]
MEVSRGQNEEKKGRAWREMGAKFILFYLSWSFLFLFHAAIHPRMLTRSNFRIFILHLNLNLGLRFSFFHRLHVRQGMVGESAVTKGSWFEHKKCFVVLVIVRCLIVASVKF